MHCSNLEKFLGYIKKVYEMKLLFSVTTKIQRDKEKKHHCINESYYHLCPVVLVLYNRPKKHRKEKIARNVTSGLCLSFQR